MTTAVTKPNASNQLKGWLNSDQFKNEVGRSLPKHLNSERFIRIALNAALTTPKLADCTKASVFKCLLDLAALGVEPNGRDAHLIPFEDRRAGVTICQLIVDFKGLVQIVKRAPGVVSVTADVVRANDEFQFQQGNDPFLKHTFGLSDRGAIVGAFAIVRTTTGESFNVLTLEEIEEVRRGSRAGNNGPWKTHFAEMAKKTAFRRLTKWLELPAEISAAIETVDTEKPDADPRFPDSGAQTIDLAPQPQQIAEESEPEPFEPEEPKPARRTRAQERGSGGRKPAAREYGEKDADALRAEFGAILTEAGASFDDFLIWAEESGMIKDTGSAGTVDELPLTEVARCVNAKAGLIAALKERAK